MSVNNVYTWREHRPRTVMLSQIPIFIDCMTTKVPNYMHHTSLYAFTAEEARIQMRLGNTKNRPIKHYSSELVIDTDDERMAEQVWNKLCEEDYVFELWKLNNYKFFLQRAEEDEPSESMVYQDRQFVSNLMSGTNDKQGLDLGIYSSPFHLIRAKNSIHEVTKAKSKLIEVNKGSQCVTTNNIELKIHESPIYYNLDSNMSDWKQLQVALDLATGNAANKHLAIWQLGKDLKRVMSFTIALEIAFIYAKSLEYCELKTERALRQAYGE